MPRPRSCAMSVRCRPARASEDDKARKLFAWQQRWTRLAASRRRPVVNTQPQHFIIEKVGRLVEFVEDGQQRQPPRGQGLEQLTHRPESSTVASSRPMSRTRHFHWLAVLHGLPTRAPPRLAEGITFWPRSPRSSRREPASARANPVKRRKPRSPGCCPGALKVPTSRSHIAAAIGLADPGVNSRRDLLGDVCVPSPWPRGCRC